MTWRPEPRRFVAQNRRGTRPRTEGSGSPAAICPVLCGQVRSDQRRRPAVPSRSVAGAAAGPSFHPQRSCITSCESSPTPTAVGVGPSVGSTIWNVPVVQSAAIAQGTALVGDFGKGATLFLREGYNVRVGDSDSSDVTTNAVKLLGS